MPLQDERWTERRQRRSAKRREVSCYLQDYCNEDDDGDSDDNDNLDADDDEEEDDEKMPMMAVMMMEDQIDYIC